MQIQMRSEKYSGKRPRGRKELERESNQTDRYILWK